jgi:two-component system, NarL family, nitrate/nitrite response regulator NarL
MTAELANPSSTRPSVLLVGQNASTRAGVRLALESSVDCYDARTPAEAAAVAAVAFPSVCFVTADPDHEMGIVAELADAVPYAQIVVLTPKVREDELIAAVRAGAVGYLSDDVDPGRLPFVVRGVMRGEAAIPRVLVSRLVGELREHRKRRVILLESRESVDLTAREWEVLEQLRRRATTKEIANTLSISEVTVRRHIGTLVNKLGVGDRKAAVALVDNWSFV